MLLKSFELNTNPVKSHISDENPLIFDKESVINHDTTKWYYER